MANFDQAINIVFRNEGGFNKDLGDGEGMTYRGLTKRSDPSWSGWSYIDNYIATKGRPKEEYVFPELEQSVKDFYQGKYWGMAHGNELTNQDMADFVLSFFVSSGRAGVEINQAINKALGKKVVPVTNKLSTDSVNYLNANTATIYPVLYQQREDYLHSLATYGKFGKSWERMMAMFPSIPSFVSTKTGAISTVGIGLVLIGLATYSYIKIKNK
jgi:lysozyme family protein